jgi:drug/metabolite transporter (DMT)-like permease
MWHILLVPIFSCAVYHFVLKKIPSSVHPFFVLSFIYTVGFLISIACFFLVPQNTFVPFDKPSEFKPSTWIMLSLLGMSLVGIEYGFMLSYRSGLSPALVPVLVNASFCVLLYPVMILFQGEVFQWQKVFGAALCVGGIYFLGK